MAQEIQAARQGLDDKLNRIHNSYSVRKRESERDGDRIAYLESVITREDMDAQGGVADDACARLAWLSAHEAIRVHNKDSLLRINKTHLSVFCPGEGDSLQAEAQIVFSNQERCFIRVQLYRCMSDAQASSANTVAEYSLEGQWYSFTEAGAVAETIVAERAKQHSDHQQQSKTELSPKEQAIEDKKRRIFEGACEVIGREGYAATTIRKVAKAASVPISTMYQYIESKEDLLFMITSGCMEEIFQYMTEEMNTDHAPEQKLEEAVAAYLKYISKNRRYINLVYRETRALSRANREKIFDIERRFTQLWEAIIIEGNKEGLFDAPKSRLAANMIYFFCNVWSLRYWSIQDYTEDEVKEYLLRFIRKGLS